MMKQGFSTGCKDLTPYALSPYWMNLQGRYDMDIAEDALFEKVEHEVHPMQATG